MPGVRKLVGRLDQRSELSPIERLAEIPFLHPHMTPMYGAGMTPERSISSANVSGVHSNAIECGRSG